MTNELFQLVHLVLWVLFSQGHLETTNSCFWQFLEPVVITSFVDPKLYNFNKRPNWFFKAKTEASVQGFRQKHTVFGIDLMYQAMAD